MAYTKQNWNNGDIITADKLNHMEDGIADTGTLTVHITQGSEASTDALVMDKTVQEILDAFPNVVLETNEGEKSQIVSIDKSNRNVLTAHYDPFTQPVTVMYTIFTATSMSGYPEWIPRD